MPSLTHRKAASFVLGLFALLLLLSTSLLELKRQSLQFHTRDYNYFIEQAARYTDPGLSKRFALNIEGYNFLGLQGAEGVQSLYHAIHTEYFRYTYVLLYGLFRSPLPIYLFYSLVFFSPLLYLAWLARRGVGWRPVTMILFSLAYSLFPATLNAITGDLRPRLLYGAAWTLIVLAITLRRPFVEKLAFFLLLIGIREEGLLLGLIAAALNFLISPPGARRVRETLLWVALSGVGLAAFVGFMAWGGYRRVDAVYDPLNIARALLGPLLPLTLLILSLLLGGLILVWFRRRAALPRLLFLLAYLSALGLTGAQTVRDSLRWIAAGSPTLWETYREIATNATTSLVFYLALLLLALVFEAARTSTARRIGSGLMLSLILLFALTDLAVYPAQVAAWRARREPARLVWDFAQSHDRYQTQLLLDYDTYQAFYNFEHVFVYNRLPLWITTPKQRYYPENRAVVVKLLARQVEWAVIARPSLEPVLEMATQAGLDVQQAAANDRYVILKLR